MQTPGCFASFRVYIGCKNSTGSYPRWFAVDGNGAAHGPMTSIAPYKKGVEDLGPEGVNMEKGPKALRKMQSFLHFLAFGFFDHNFGVLRGE